MATVKALIRVSNEKKRKDVAVNVRFRLSDGRKKQLFHTSEFTVTSKMWDANNECISARVSCDNTKRSNFNRNVMERKQLILQLYNEELNKEATSSEWLDLVIDKFLYPERYVQKVLTQPSFFNDFDIFVNELDDSWLRKQHYFGLKRMLMRFEVYYSVIQKTKIELSFDMLNSAIITEFEKFLKNEFKIAVEYAEIYKQFAGLKKQKPRGENTINGILKKFKTFVLWANKVNVNTNTSRTKNNSFQNFKIKECKYGTPFFITIEERNKLFKMNMTKRPQLAIQRDIFVFQCLIGCRVGDLLKMKKSNIINGHVEYVPQKTMKDTPDTISVPLSVTAKKILARYPNTNGDRLLPFISYTNYNEDIKEMFDYAGLTRLVTTINSLTGQEEKRVLSEIASTHLARRTFIGNLYDKTQDPNIIGSMSGHKEGSKAFARYRNISAEIKTQLVNLLD